MKSSLSLATNFPNCNYRFNFRQEKNKPAAKPNPKDKKEDPLFGFKAEDELKLEALSKDSLMLNRKKKLRLNTEHPVILSEVFYPTSFSDPSMVPIKE
jgi:hypothetical protein